MPKHGIDGLGYEIVKAVNSGEIIEPITARKVKSYCAANGIEATENHMSVILPNGTDNSHSPTYKTYFERVAKGQYKILSKYRRPQKFYWLNVDATSYDWSFSEMELGRVQSYSNITSNGGKRKNESCFKRIQIGDRVLAYETGATKAITAICEVADKFEEDGKIIVKFEKVKGFSVVLDFETMKASDELADCDVVHFHRGTLFELASNHYDVLAGMLEERNPSFSDYQEALDQAVQKSRQMDPVQRKKRLEQVTHTIPEQYAATVRVFKRNPDVIAEVLNRANGNCEECKHPAPFARASDGTPYLEVHHKIRLADGGEDTVENAMAVCPNCHRKLHFG